MEDLLLSFFLGLTLVIVLGLAFFCVATVLTS
jgi:hypothetical protein